MYLSLGTIEEKVKTQDILELYQSTRLLAIQKLSSGRSKILVSSTDVRRQLHDNSMVSRTYGKSTPRSDRKTKTCRYRFELIDARLPLSSRNPMIDEVIHQKSRLLILNKVDLADDMKQRNGYIISKHAETAQLRLTPLKEKECKQ